MKRIIFIIALVAYSNLMLGQQDQKIKIARKIYHFADKGYKKRNALYLYKASKLLVKNPAIGTIKTSYTDEPNYFDRNQLLIDAKNYANKKSFLYRKIEKLMNRSISFEVPTISYDANNYLVAANSKRVVPIPELSDGGVHVFIEQGTKLIVLYKGNIMAKNKSKLFFSISKVTAKNIEIRNNQNVDKQIFIVYSTQ